jgi:hypothetical protein
MPGLIGGEGTEFGKSPTSTVWNSGHAIIFDGKASREEFKGDPSCIYSLDRP